MPHDIVDGRIGHNHAETHLHSHMPDADRAAELQVLAGQFIEGFTAATDKTAYLRLAGVAFERPGKSGAGEMKLVDVELRTDFLAFDVVLGVTGDAVELACEAERRDARAD